MRLFAILAPAPAPGDNLKTIASVGDKPLPVRSGPSDSSVRAEVAEADLPAPGRGRISGRVYDDRGKAVNGARVRLAVGGESGGKAVYANTDPSGAFTLRGLRPGSSYTLIAEYQGRSGLLTGRAQAKAPSSSVRIGLNPRNAAAEDSPSTIRPARPSVAPISSIEEADESNDEEEQEATGRTNREDLEPPAPEADTVGETERASSTAPGPCSVLRRRGRPGAIALGLRNLPVRPRGRGGQIVCGRRAQAVANRRRDHRMAMTPMETKRTRCHQRLSPRNREPAWTRNKAVTARFCLHAAKWQTRDPAGERAPAGFCLCSRPTPAAPRPPRNPTRPPLNPCPRAWWREPAQSLRAPTPPS